MWNCLKTPELSCAIQADGYLPWQLHWRIGGRQSRQHFEPLWIRGSAGNRVLQRTRTAAVPEHYRVHSLQFPPPFAGFVGLLKVSNGVHIIIETERAVGAIGIPRLLNHFPG